MPEAPSPSPSPSPASSPRVSVLVAAYDSNATLGGLLEALARQTFRDFETVVVDSGPSGGSEALCEGRQGVRLLRPPGRLMPHQARWYGAERSTGGVLVFTDADIYPRPDWLERLLAAHDAGDGAPVVGALVCHGSRFRDRGIHYCKFSKWLPAGARRPIDIGPTAALLISRDDLGRHGGSLADDPWMGDVALSWRLRSHGPGLWFEPRAVAEHHHLTGWRDFLRERRGRGRLYSRLFASQPSVGRGAVRRRWLATALGPRLASNLARSFAHAASAGWGMAADWLWTFPVHLTGWIATMAGEARGLAESLEQASSAQREPVP